MVRKSNRNKTNSSVGDNTAVWESKELKDKLREFIAGERNFDSG
jgi:hypothetical protein